MSSIIALFIMYLVVYDGFIVVVLLAIGFGTACLALEVNGSTGFLTGFEWPYLMIVSFVLICGSVLSADHINQTNILKFKADFDSLTGLHNRRYMDELLRSEFARATRSGTSLGVMMIDVDHFKQINDRFGHLVGDSILKELGSQLAQLIREEDVACRYGGDEFLIILPGVDYNSLEKRAEQVREQIAGKLIYSHENTTNPQAITISIGLSILSLGGRIDDLINTADTALYLAKQNGRNRVESLKDC